MTDTAVRLAAHLPRTLRQRLVQGPSLVEVEAGAALFVDIAGFTALSERLATQGALGAERLAALLNARFGRLIELVHAYGGDVARFAGDALVAVFPAEAAGGLLAASRLGAACGRACLEVTDSGSERLHLTVTLGVGSLRLLVLHGNGQRRDFLLVGSAVAQAAALQERCRPGQVLVSAEAADCIGLAGRLAQQPDGSALLLHAHQPTDRNPLPAPQPSQADLVPFVPAVVQSRLAAGQAEYIAELRAVSVLFVHIGGIDLDGPEAEPRADQALVAVEGSLSELGGSLDKMLFDDKGLLAIGVFGLPGQALEDGPVRAALAALAIRSRLEAVGLDSCIGVTTGPAFCGTYGGPERREYTILGHTVNLAARLMAAARSEVLSDDATRRRSGERVRFEQRPAVAVKGASEPVPVWTVLAPGHGRREAPATRGADLIGRHQERSQLQGFLQGAGEGQPGGVFVVEGEAGMGKTTLLAGLLRQARAAGLGVLFGAGDAIESSTAWFSWRAVLATLAGADALDLGSADDALRARCRDRLGVLLGQDARLRSWLPLLDDLLPLGFEASDTTRQMDGQARSDSLRDILVQLLHGACAEQPHLLVIEDCHWLDSASWGLLVGAARAVPELRIVLCTRPLDEPVPAEWDELVDLAGEQHLELAAMSEADAVAVAAHKLGVERLPPQVERLVATRGEGNPLFSEELVGALHDSGLLELRDGQAHLVPAAGKLDDLEFPSTVQGVIGSRIDRLDPRQQLGLKVASVIGRVFAYRILRDIHPVEADRPELLDYLHAVEHTGLTLLERPDPDPAWLFRHALIQDVAYGLMIPSQRARLHAAVAAWYEGRYAEDLGPWLPLLAHHYARAGDDERAVNYMARAGAQALSRYANDEALRFYSQAMERHLTLGRSEPERRAVWLLASGEALRRLGRWDEGADCDRKALALLGQPEPQGTAALVLGCMVQLGLQALHLLLPSLWVSREAGPPGSRAMTACYQALAQNYYRQNRMVELLYASVAATNLADKAGPCLERVPSYGAAGMQASLTGLGGLARSYHARGRAVAQELGSRRALGEHAQLVLATAVAAGDWATASAAHEEAAEIHRELGDRYMWELDASLWGFALMHKGRWQDSDRVLDELWASAHPHGSPQNQALARLGQFVPELWRDRLEPERLEQVEALVELGVPVVDEVLALGLLSLAWLRQGDPHKAVALVEAAEERFVAAPPSTYYCMTGLAAVVQTCLELPVGTQGLPSRVEALAHADRATRALRLLAQLNPVVRPRASLVRSLLAQARGRSGAARRLARAALRSGQALDMPHEVAMARWQLSRCTPGDQVLRDQAAAELEACEVRSPMVHWPAL